MKPIIKYETKKTLAVLRERNGYTKELRLVSWNNAEPKLDLREWMPDGKCGKGMTLTNEEARMLMGALEEFFSGEDAEHG